jgi:glycosyltransferase involved in cell wall biosynthesis
VLNEENAFFVEPGDTDALSHAMQTVIGNPEEANKRAQKAQRDVQSYSWHERAQALQSFFSHL